MIVAMRTTIQAGQVTARVPGAVHLPGRPKPAGTVPFSRLVDVGPDFEAVRELVEQVSVLYQLFDGNAAACVVSGSPGARVATGWLVTGAKFEVEWPADPARASVVRSHFGARRKAYNYALGVVKADLDANRDNPGHEPAPWTLADLRKKWNTDKVTVAPWWAENSKEAYATGIDDLVTALANWRASKNRTRKGRRVGFPRFKAKRKDRARVRFTTGTMRFEADRRTITVPRIGALRSQENTRRVQRHLASGRARILNMTVSEHWGRLFVSVNYALFTPASYHRSPRMPHVRAGVDLGVRTLATINHIDPDTGRSVITEVRNPAPLRATLIERRKAGRQMSRRIPGSRGHQSAKAKLTRLDRRAVHLRREAAHQLTTDLARRFGEIVIEDLDIAAMKKSMGRRAYRRSVSDAAMGLIRPMLTYKVAREGGALAVAGRWFPSSQLHHGHTLPDGTACRLIGKGRIDKHLTCPATGEVVDRDHNAARNLRDWPDMPVGAQSAPRPRMSAVLPVAGETPAQTRSERSTARLRSARKTTPHPGVAVRGEARTTTQPVRPGGRTP